MQPMDVLLGLTQVDALIFRKLPRQLAALVLRETPALEYGRRVGYPSPRRRPNADTPANITPDHLAAENVCEAPAFVSRRLPLALVRVYGVECCLCQGAGCCECAYTGLR